MSTRIQMTGLRRLHEMMTTLPTERHQFVYKVNGNGREFDCLFYVGSPVPDHEPETYELSLTSTGLNPIHIPFAVNRWYWVNTEMEPRLYRALAELLRVHGQSFQRLVPSQFLADLNKHIGGIRSLRPPKFENSAHTNLSGPSTSSYFSHWRYHKPPKGPSKENQDKNIAAHGSLCSDHSLGKNASSVWKDP